jgi:hypothetical protein
MKLSLFATPSNATVPLRTVRLYVEELSERTLPSTSPIFIAASQVARDVTEVRADIIALQTLLAGTSNARVLVDLTTISIEFNDVLEDLNEGVSPADDLAALAAARTRLGIDIGTNISTTLRTQLAEFSRDVSSLTRHVAQLGDGIDGQLDDVQQAADDLTAALSSNTNPTVIADLAAMNAAVDAVEADLVAGESATASLAALVRAEARLTADLRSAPRAIRTDLNDLRRETGELVADLALTGRFIDRTAGAVQRNVLTLTRLLGSNGNATIVADLQILRAASVTLASRVAADTATVDDVEAVTTALNKLQADLGTVASRQVTQAINDLNTNLTALSISLAAMTVQA